MTNRTAPLVTVCIPTRDRSSYLVTAIESVLGQSYPNIELIIADDASTDDTRAVVESYGPRIQYICNPVRLGMAGNWQAALRAGRGKYVGFLNDDDFYGPDMIRSLVEPLERHSHVGLSFCDHFVTDAEGRILPQETDRLSRATGRSHLPEGIVKDPLLLAVRFNAFPIIGTLFRYEGIRRTGYIDISIDNAPDLDLFYRITSAYSAFYTPKKLAYFRLHEAQSTTGPGSANRTLGNLESVVRALSKIQSSNRKVRRARQVQLANIYSQIALAMAQRGRDPRTAIVQALAFGVFHPRCMRKLLRAQIVWMSQRVPAP